MLSTNGIATAYACGLLGWGGVECAHVHIVLDCIYSYRCNCADMRVLLPPFPFAVMLPPIVATVATTTTVSLPPLATPSLCGVQSGDGGSFKRDGGGGPDSSPAVG